VAKFKDQLKTKLYLDYKDNKLETLSELDWLLENVPCFHPSLYKDAEEIITNLLTQEKNKKKIKEYKSRLRDIETLKSKYFGDD
jgi:hypothetical protein